MKQIKSKDDDEDPTDIDVEKYKLDAVKDSVLETVEACNEETTKALMQIQLIVKRP